MTLTFPLPSRDLRPNARANRWDRAALVRRAREAAFFAMLKAMGCPAVPERILFSDVKRLNLGERRDAGFYQKFSAYLHPAAPPVFAGYELAFYFARPQEVWDDDNAVGAAKSARDGIADALRINDKQFPLLGLPLRAVDRKNPRMEIHLIPKVSPR